MKNRSFKLWDKALMIEAINQTKWPAAIMFVLSALALLYQDITELIIKFEYFYIVICAFAMFMVYRLFSFQNKRVSSDLYHGLPKSRGMIFVSFITAVIIWFLIEIPVCLAANDIIIQTGVNKYFHWESIIRDSLYYIAGIIQLMGITSFAMALTGNTVANILAAVSLMVVPRILINSYIDVFYDLCPFLTENHVLQKWSSPDFNILYTLYAKAMRIYNNPVLVFDFWEDELLSETIRHIATVYSAVLGFFYMGFGGIFFKKRMSENAGKSTTNAIVQLMLKVAVTMAICVAPTSIVSESIINGQGLAIGDLVLMYLVAVLAWFLIDLLTLGKHFNIKKCAVLLPVLVLLNVVAGTVIVTGTLGTAGHIPEIDELKSIRVIGDIVVEENEEYVLQGDFVKQLELTDEDIKELMLNKLNEEMSLFKDDYASYKKLSCSGEVGRFEVAFETEKGVIYRNLYDDISVQNKLYEALKEAAADAYDYELPVTENTSAGNYVSYLSILNNNDYRLTGKLYAELYKELSENEYPMSYYLERGNEDKAVLASFVRTEQGYDYILPVTVDTPETLKTFIELTNEGFDLAYIDTDKEEDYSRRVIAVKVYSTTKNKYYYGKRIFDGVFDLKNVGKKLESFKKIIEADEEIDIYDNLVAVELWYSNVYIGCRWCNVTDEELDVLVNMSSLNFAEISDVSELYD